MKTYVEGVIEEVFQRVYENIQSAIDLETDNYILNVNIEEYSEHLASQYFLDFPILFEDKVYADSYEMEIPAERFPGSFYVEPGQSYKRDIIVFFLPYTGNITLLKYRPANRYNLSGGMEINPGNDTIRFEYINFNNSPDELKQEFQKSLYSLKVNFNYLKEDCDSFNENLVSKVKTIVNTRKQSILKRDNLLSSLGVPLRKKDNVSETFSVPSPKLKEKIKVKPIVIDKRFKPEPTLDENNYYSILKIINDVGKNFERLPSVYWGKKEEDLRDHILLTLDPNFEFGAATGETFNKSGKTDILLRYDSDVIFIAECKFWKGSSGFIDTIDQLLGYLTWRDSKAAIVLFVKNKEISSVLKSIQETIIRHNNYLGFSNQPAENWFNYRLHINGDSNREIKLAVLVYHIPERP